MMVNTFLGPVRISGEPSPFMENLYYHDERIAKGEFRPLASYDTFTEIHWLWNDNELVAVSIEGLGARHQ